MKFAPPRQSFKIIIGDYFVGDKTMNHPEATSEALSILRSSENFQWYVIFMLILVLYLYFNEVNKKNWKGIASGLMLYSIHWFCEIINGLIQYFTGHALWTIPKGTSYLLLIGVGIELSLMFSIAGLVQSKVLPDNPSIKIMGLPNRLVIGLGNAALASIIEIFLVTTPTFIWIWEWWNAFTVFIFVYIPFFVIAAYAYDWPSKKQIYVLGTLIVINIILLITFVGFLHWI